MQKIRLTERQILILQKLQKESPKTKVMKINEDQYERLFRGGFNTNTKVDRSIRKNELDESPKEKVNLLEFAQELIVFIKDMLSRPQSAPFSKFWLNLGISKDRLIKMLEKEGLLTLSLDETDGTEKYVSEKYGFRRKVRECYNKIIKEWGDAGYPAGAEFDPNAPWNQEDPDPEPEDQIITVPDEQKKFRIIHMGQDGVGIFKAGKELFVASLSDIGDINDDPENDGESIYYYDYNEPYKDDITPQGFEDWVNISHNEGLIKPVRNDKTNRWPVPTLITPAVKNQILKYYGEDGKMTDILAQLPETTGAASSGAYVAGASFGNPIQKDTGDSPEEAMKNIISDGVDSTGVVPFHSQRSGEEPFIIDGIKWEYVNADYNGKIDIGVYRYGQDITYSYDWFRKNVLKGMDETTALGGPTGINTKTNGNSIEYDTPGFAKGGDVDMFAGNKENKKMKEGEMPLIRREIKESFHTPEGTPIPVDKDHKPVGPPVGYESWEAYDEAMKLNEQENPRQTYLRYLDMYKKSRFSLSKNDPQFKQLKKNLLRAAKDIGIDLQLENIKPLKGVLKITEDQLKRIMERDNMTSTAYPNGEMVDFDDCTKLNNNTKAQDGGCSQGAVDNVVKTKKTKHSVVAEVAKQTGRSIEDVTRILKEYDGSERGGRYVAEADFYLWAKTDEEAVAKANELIKNLGINSHAKLTNLVRQPFGKFGNTPVDF